MWDASCWGRTTRPPRGRRYIHFDMLDLNDCNVSSGYALDVSCFLPNRSGRQYKMTVRRCVIDFPLGRSSMDRIEAEAARRDVMQATILGIDDD